MLRSAEVANLARRAKEFGIDIDGAIEPDIDAIVERKDDIVESIRKGPTRTSSNENIDFVEGHGIFESPHEIRVDDRTPRPETIVINTGARPTGRRSTALDIDVHGTDLLERASIPPSLAVIGGGYVGCEYAQMYSRFGADVTVFQRGDTLLPDERSGRERGGHRDGLRKRRNHRPDRYASDGTHGDQRRHPCRRRCRRHRLRHRLGRCLAAGRTPNTDGLQTEDIGASLDENGSSGPTTASERLLTVSTPLAT